MDLKISLVPCLSTLEIDFIYSISSVDKHGTKDFCLYNLLTIDTVEFQWLEYLWNYENMFAAGVVRANEC